MQHRCGAVHQQEPQSTPSNKHSINIQGRLPPATCSGLQKFKRTPSTKPTSEQVMSNVVGNEISIVFWAEKLHFQILYLECIYIIYMQQGDKLCMTPWDTTMSMKGVAFPAPAGDSGHSLVCLLED